jgi:pimeloyl-ACP methyl ester carboxylesterase
VYDDRPEVKGWEPVSLRELSVPPELDRGMTFVNGNAVAFVREAMIGRERTLAVVFRGTDIASLSDWRDNVFGIGIHWERMRPLVDSIDAYVRARGINRVIATGHSLGGAMAEMFLASHPDGEGVRYLGCTFGSPGAPLSRDFRDKRLVEFTHARDPVPFLGAFRPFAPYHRPGRVILIGDGPRHSGVLGMFEAHSMNSYVESAEAFSGDHEAAAEILLEDGDAIIQVEITSSGPRAFAPSR